MSARSPIRATDPPPLVSSVEAMAAHAGAAARLLKALANENRLMILCLLVDGPLSVGEINERIGLSQSALSQHLAVLRNDGLVQAERVAQTVRYWLPEGPTHRILQTLHAIYCAPKCT